jgi:predicted DNA-binding transcriptional regulator AlpA
MPRNSNLLQDEGLEQLTELMTKVVRAENNAFLKHYAPVQPKEYLTRSGVAKMLSIDISTVHNMCKSKRLNPLTLGGSRVYFLRSEVEASLKPINV